MARNNQRDERDWHRGQEQNSPEQNRWSGTRRDDDNDWNDERQQGRDWRRQGQEGNWNREDDWRGNAEIDDRWNRNQRMSGWQRPWERNAERSNRQWSEMSEGYGQLGGRGWYEGYTDAMHREQGQQGQQGQHAGRGPRNYKRSDSRIEEDINDRLTQHSMIDATDVEVSVQNGEVTLKGYVEDRQAKRMAEDIAESVSGVKDVNNQMKIRQRGSEESRTETETSGKQRKAS
jgi:osmotically-inducible protein OsmY